MSSTAYYPDGLSTRQFIDRQLAENAGMTVRLANALIDEAREENGCKTVGDLRRVDDRVLLRIPNFGKKSLAELRGLIGYHQQDSAAGNRHIEFRHDLAPWSRREALVTG
jgi:DNA-directed RNA polymerase alpha subunit